MAVEGAEVRTGGRRAVLVATVACLALLLSPTGAGAAAPHWWERTYVAEVALSSTQSYLEVLAACDASDQGGVAANLVPGAPRYGVIGDSVAAQTRAANLADRQVGWIHGAHCGESFGTARTSGRVDAVLAAAPDVISFGFGTNSASEWAPDVSRLPQAKADFDRLLDRTDGVRCRVLFNVPEQLPSGMEPQAAADLALIQRTINSWMAGIDAVRHPGVTVVDWRSLTAADPALLWDTQHLSRAGINARINLTLARTRSCFPPDPPAAVAAIGAGGVATVWWTPAAPEEGVTAYRVTSSLGQQVTTPSPTVNVAGIPAGTPVTFTVEALNGRGASAPSPRSAAMTVTTGGARFVASAPRRVLDTRDGTGARVGTVGPGEALSVPLAGVPSEATAVALNVTAVDPTAPTFVTVWPGGQSRPLVSNLNPAPGVPVLPAMVTTRLGAGSTVQVFNNSGRVHLVADVIGWFVPTLPPSTEPAGALFTPLTPSRALDTRIGTGGPRRPMGSGEVRRLLVPGLPAGATAVALNVTATNVGAASFVTVFPADAPRPLASNLNPQPGRTAANLTVSAVSAGGEIALYNNSGPVDLVVDVVGVYGPAGARTGGAEYVAVTPERAYDTRDGTGGLLGPRPGGLPASVSFAGRGSVPSTAVAVDVNVTVVGADAAGHTSIWPTGPLPSTSVLNYRAGEVVANRDVVTLSGGSSRWQSTASLHYVADVSGWYQPVG
ncbi:MAG: hypothetical protein R2726_21960 [Acidimicrobiales bacterium]